MIRTPEEQRLHELIESYVNPLRREIKELRQELNKKEKIHLPGEKVSKTKCGRKLEKVKHSIDINSCTCKNCNH